MNIATLLNKIKNSNGVTVGYKIQWYDGSIQQFDSAQMRAYLQKGYKVAGLRLNKAGHIIDDKSVTRSDNSKTTDSNFVKAAKILMDLDKSLLGMGDSWQEVIESRCYMAGIKIPYDASDAKYDKCAAEAYYKIITNKHLLNSFLANWFEYGATEMFEDLLEYERVTDTTKTSIYKKLFVIYNIAKQVVKVSVPVIKQFEDCLEAIRSHKMKGMKMVYEIAHDYFRHLDKDKFGVTTNSVYTVGHILTNAEIKENPRYVNASYIAHKDINLIGSGALDFEIVFKCQGKYIYVTINAVHRRYLSKNCLGGLDFVCELSRLNFSLKDNVEESSARLANQLNNDVTKIQALLAKHPEYMRPAPVKE